MNFFYSIIETLLHSIWQAALLVCAYLFVIITGKNYHPLQKRNFLYFLLLTQFCISIITLYSFFYSYQFETEHSLFGFFQKTKLPFLQNYYGIIFTVYIGIVTLKITQLIIQWASFKTRFTAQLKRPSPDLKIFTAYHADLLCLKNNVTLWFSQTLQTPVTFGFLKPVILLPLSLINNITAQQAELIILHELIHIKSKDYLLNWFLLIMETIYFFNPFIKIIAEKLKLEREKNCDIQVLNYQYGSVEYAETLYEIAQNNADLKKFQLGIFKNNSQLYKRISFFSEAENLSYKKLNTYIYSFVFFLIAGTISFTMLSKAPTKRMNDPVASSFFVRENFQKTRLLTTTTYSKEVVTSTNNENKRHSSLIQRNDELMVPPFLVEYPDVASENIYTPIAYNETPDSAKEVIYNVETKNKTITQSYKLIKKKGLWVYEPQWMVVETRPDSLQLSIKDSIFTLPE